MRKRCAGNGKAAELWLDYMGVCSGGWPSLVFYGFGVQFL